MAAAAVQMDANPAPTADRLDRAGRLTGGITCDWMRTSAARLGIHLAGSLLLLEPSGIYNALLLCLADELGSLFQLGSSDPVPDEIRLPQGTGRISVSVDPAHVTPGRTGPRNRQPLSSMLRTRKCAIPLHSGRTYLSGDPGAAAAEGS